MHASVEVHKYSVMATFVSFVTGFISGAASHLWKVQLLVEKEVQTSHSECVVLRLAANHNYGGGNPMRPHRVRLTHSLVSNYGLNSKMYVHRPQARSKEQIEEFHCDGEPHSCMPSLSRKVNSFLSHGASIGESA